MHLSLLTVTDSDTVTRTVGLTGTLKKYSHSQISVLSMYSYEFGVSFVLEI